MISIAIYEDYCNHLHGNQKDIVTLVKYYQGSKNKLNFIVFIPKDGILFKEIKKYNKSSYILRANNIVMKSIRLCNFIKKSNSRAIFVSNEKSFVVALLSSILLRLPIVWYVKNSDKLHIITLLSFVFSGRILTYSKSLLLIKNKILTKLYSNKIYQLENGLDLSEMYAIKPVLRTNKPISLLFMGAICKNKGIDLLINSLSDLDKKNISCNVTIAGGVPSKQINFVEKYKAESAKFNKVNVNWIGWQKNVHKLMEKADVIVLPSRSEGVPKSIIEAFAAARPVITSNVGAVDTIVKDMQNGLLLNDISSDDLTNKIIYFINNKDKIIEMGCAGRKHVREKYNLNKHVNKLENHFMELLIH